MAAVRDTFSPKDLARALGVSESSIKRWIDDGRIKAARTPGKHRRVELVEVLRFLRESESQLVAPEVLGMAPIAEPMIPATRNLDDGFVQALKLGDGEAVRSLIMLAFARTRSVAELCDEVLERYDESARDADGSGGAFLRHMAYWDCVSAMQALREVAPQADPLAPLAVVADLSRPIDGLAAHAAEVVLSHSGWRVAQLGVSVPGEVLGGAIHRLRPSLVWVSSSHHLTGRSPGEVVGMVWEQARSCGAQVVARGRAIDRVPSKVKRIEALTDFSGLLPELSAA